MFCLPIKLNDVSLTYLIFMWLLRFRCWQVWLIRDVLQLRQVVALKTYVGVCILRLAHLIIAVVIP